MKINKQIKPIITDLWWICCPNPGAHPSPSGQEKTVGAVTATADRSLSGPAAATPLERSLEASVSF